MNIKISYLLYFIIILITCVQSGKVQASSKNSKIPKMYLSVDNKSPLPGDTITFTVSFGSPFDVQEVASNVIPQIIGGVNLQCGKEISIFDKTYPYQWNIDLPNRSSGVSNCFASTFFVPEYIASNEVTITIIPYMSNLHQIFFNPGHRCIMSLNNNEKMSVIGRFSDGYNRNITEEIFGTVYSEEIVDGLTITTGDSPVISISEDGIVTATKIGIANVVATNSGISNIRRIRVVKGNN